MNPMIAPYATHVLIGQEYNAAVSNLAMLVEIFEDGIAATTWNHRAFYSYRFFQMPQYLNIGLAFDRHYRHGRSIKSCYEFFHGKVRDRHSNFAPADEERSPYLCIWRK